MRFHDVIYEAANNPQAVDIVKIIKQQLKRLQFKTILVPGRNDHLLVEHRAIYKALKNGDLEQAESEVKQHVANVRKTIEENYNVLI